MSLCRWNPGLRRRGHDLPEVDHENDEVDKIPSMVEGCTISQAAASILTSWSRTLPLSEIEAMDYPAMMDIIGEGSGSDPPTLRDA